MTSAAHPPEQRPLVFLRAIHLLIAGSVLTVALAGYFLLFGHRQSLEKAATDTANMAAMMEARFDATLRRAVSILEFSATLPTDSLLAGNAPRFKKEIEKTLRTLTSHFPEILVMTIFDAQGDYLYSSITAQEKFSIRNRDYFQHLKRNASAGLVFSDVTTGLRYQQPILPMALPLRDAQGRFLGITQVAIRLHHFQRRLEELDIGRSSLIVVRRIEDSRLVLRHPELPGEINKPAITPLSQHIQAGNRVFNMRFASPVDEITRTYGARALESFPFFIGVAVADRDALAAWYNQVIVTLTLVTLLLGAVWWYFFRITRDDQIRRQLIAERETQARLTQERAQQIQTIVDTAADGIVTFNEAGTIQSFNRAAEHIFGHQAQDIIGRPVSTLMPDPYHRELAAYLKRSVQQRGQGVIGASREVQGLRRDGSTFPLDVAISRSVHEGQPLFVGLVRDITERKRLEQMKSEFVSTVSHELRTPLTSISGALGLVCGGALGPVTEQAKTMLDIAHKNSLRLTHLINDLLDMEKLTAGKMRFDLREQEIMPLVEQSLESTQAYAQQHQVRLVLTRRADGVRVRVDASRLQQVLSNFLSNAAKFSPQGAQVEVAVRQIPGAVRVEVIDYGPGIPEEFKSRIFQKFSQADSSDTRQKGGTGLGLAISQELIMRMNGQVGFESQPGQGACFYFDLPVS